jgi:type I restriction enzyme, R subunit
LTSIKSNFAFLREHEEQLLRIGLFAERYFAPDPNTCLLKLRQLAELLAQLLAARAGMREPAGESQYDLVHRLQDCGVLPREIAQLFGEVRRAGNAANHSLDGDHRAALNALKLTWQIALWFHRTFANPAFRAGPFVPPEAPRGESAELKAESTRTEFRRVVDALQAF